MCISQQHLQDKALIEVERVFPMIPSEQLWTIKHLLQVCHQLQILVNWGTTEITPSKTGRVWSCRVAHHIEHTKWHRIHDSTCNTIEKAGDLTMTIRLSQPMQLI